MPSVTSCKLRGNPRPRASFDERNRGTYGPVEWTIQTDGPMGPRSVANGAQSVGPNPLPDLWSTYDYLGDTDTTSYLRSLEIRPEDESRKVYRAKGVYSPLGDGETAPSGQNSGYTNTDPIARPPFWRPYQETYTVLAEKDVNGDPILNSAGQPFDPTYEYEQTHSGVTATINYPDLASAFDAIQRMSEAVNSVEWRGRDPRSVRCKGPRVGEPVTEGATTFYPVTFYFVFKEEGETWDVALLDQGTSYFETPNDPDSIKPAEDVVNLKSDGTKLPPGQGEFRDFRIFREVDFEQEMGF